MAPTTAYALGTRDSRHVGCTLWRCGSLWQWGGVELVEAVAQLIRRDGETTHESISVMCVIGWNDSRALGRSGRPWPESTGPGDCGGRPGFGPGIADRRAPGGWVDSTDGGA